ncbi:MAG: hypothetical protein KDJ52_27580 [Anaerolineae bacterium]|nr:hypothetical protein [Anaerolineae bacterium]
MTDITNNDKILAALSYPIWIVAIVILLVEDMRNRPFQKYHAIQSLAVNLVIFVLGLITSWTIVLPCLIWFVTLYWAYEAYQGKYFTIPVLTDFLKGQGWI